MWLLSFGKRTRTREHCHQLGTISPSQQLSDELSRTTLVHDKRDTQTPAQTPDQAAPSIYHFVTGMPTTPPPTHVNSSSSAPLRQVESGASERAYGTFEVTVIDVESENCDSSKDDECVHGEDSHGTIWECGGGLCHSQDCCLLMTFLCAPIRLRTYRVLLFHVASFLFAVVASAWTIALLCVKLISLVSISASWRTFAQRFESKTLRSLLCIDATLFNFMSPVEERVKVHSLLASNSEDEFVFFGLPTQLYYGIIKFVGSAVPGLVSASVFLWTLQHLSVVVRCVFVITSSSCDAIALDPSTVIAGSHFLTTPEQELDLLVLVAVVAVYGATTLLQVTAYVSRHVTIFFCAEHLRSSVHL